MIKKSNLMASSIYAAIMLLAFGLTVQAKPGDLDLTFGSGGVVSTTFANLSATFVSRSALQPDGKIVVVGGGKYVGDQYEPFVARYNTDGTLDTTFGSGGIVTTRFTIPNQGSNNESGYFAGVAVQPDGKIVAAGHSEVGFLIGTTSVSYSDPIMARYNSNGTLDASFGSGGRVMTQTGISPDINGGGAISSLALAQDATIYAVGKVDFQHGQDANGGGILYRQALAIRYSSGGGVLNSSYYNVGPNESNGHANEQRKSGNASTLQADGKLVFSIIGTGLYGNPLYVSDFVLMRVNLDLTPDATFGTGGQVRTNFGTPLEQANGIVIDPNGNKIVVAGANDNGNNSSGSFYAARYNPDGTLDLKFGVGGKLLLLRSDSPFAGDSKGGGSIARQPDGKYVVALTDNNNLGAIRLLPSGSLDPTFGASGIAEYNSRNPGSPYPSINGWGGQVLLQADGKIVLPASEGNDFGQNGVKIIRLTNETVTGNPIDVPDAFVRQHYSDFLSRQPDASGLAFWTNEITSCNGDAQCIDIKRQNVSAAYFLSREFQETGFFVIRLQRVAFGKVSIDATKRITFQQLLTDAGAVGKGFVDGQAGADQVLDQNKTAYAQAVAASQSFIAKYPTTLSASAYVDALYTSAGVTPQGTERQDAINAFGSGDTAGRAATLRKVAESISVKDAEFRSAFVLLQYFGYLRRNPTDAPDNNDGGYQFWLGKLNQFNGDYIRSEMVRAFILSSEYRNRFGTP